jgi:hypothetical protein
MDLLPPDLPPHVFPVGRLDRDTEGLLLLTNDGEFAHRLAHPRYELDKEYYALVKGVPPSAAIESLRRGVEIEGRRTFPAQVDVGRRPPRAHARPHPHRRGAARTARGGQDASAVTPRGGIAEGAGGAGIARRLIPAEDTVIAAAIIARLPEDRRQQHTRTPAQASGVGHRHRRACRVR